MGVSYSPTVQGGFILKNRLVVVRHWLVVGKGKGAIRGSRGLQKGNKRELEG